MPRPDSLESIARNHEEQPYFRFLYVGDDPARWEVLRHSVAATDCFESIGSISQEELRQSAKKGQRRMDLAVVHLRGCLIEVWDLADRSSSESLQDVIRSLPVETLWSPQAVRFGLVAEGSKVRFRDFITAIERDFAAIGGIDDCMNALAAWCGPGSIDDPRKLRMSAPKLPSAWLGALKHDYFGNVVPHIFRGSSELNGRMISNDFWHDTVRNVLRFPFYNSPGRSIGLVESDHNSEDALIRQISTTACELVVPPWMDDLLRERGGWVRGEEYSVYSGGDDAAECLEASSRRGRTRLLIRDTALLPDSPPVAGVPTVLVGETEQRMTWEGWTGALSTNTLGSFSRTDFAGRSRGCLPITKAAYWKRLCFVTLAEALENVLRPMLETYAWLATNDESSANNALRLSLFRCIAQVWYAKGLYFGSPSMARTTQEAVT